MALPRVSEKRKEYIGYINRAFDNVERDNTLHLITWNPKPKFYGYCLFGKNDYDSQWDQMLSILLLCNRCLYNYSFVAEISEEGKLHVHGFYQVYDKVKYHRSFLPSLKKNGFVKHNKARSYDRKVIKYHKKDIRDTIEHMADQSVPVVLTAHTIKDLKQNHVLRTIQHSTEAIKRVSLEKWLPLVAQMPDWTERSEEIY